MRERVLPHLGQRSGFTAMLRVTIIAGKRGTLLFDRAVQFRHIFHLFGNIRMTSRTAIRHGIPSQRKNVTSRTCGDFSVRRYAAVSVACLRVQSTRRKHLSAA